MPGIDPNVITHRLNVSLFYKLVRQKKRVFALKRDNIIKEEVQKLEASSSEKSTIQIGWSKNLMAIGGCV